MKADALPVQVDVTDPTDNGGATGGGMASRGRDDGDEVDG